MGRCRGDGRSGAPRAGGTRGGFLRAQGGPGWVLLPALPPAWGWAAWGRVREPPDLPPISPKPPSPPGKKRGTENEIKA